MYSYVAITKQQLVITVNELGTASACNSEVQNELHKYIYVGFLYFLTAKAI